MTFSHWIDLLLSEKGIDGDELIQAEGASGLNYIPVSILVDAIKAAPAHEQAGIQTMLIKIDFVAPGRKPILDYLAHLGQAIAI